MVAFQPRPDKYLCCTNENILRVRSACNYNNALPVHSFLICLEKHSENEFAIGMYGEDGSFYTRVRPRTNVATGAAAANDTEEKLTIQTAGPL